MYNRHKDNKIIIEIADFFRNFINLMDELAKFIKDNELIKKIYLPTEILKVTQKNQIAITTNMSENDAFNILNSENPNEALFNYFLKNNEEN